MTIFLRLFPAAELALWAGFLTLDLTRWGDSTPLKYLGICLCLLAALLLALPAGPASRRRADARRVLLAQGLTLAADTFLLLLDRGEGDRILGLCLFLAVQAVYARRLYVLRDKTPCRWGLALRGAALAVAVVLARTAGLLTSLAGVYFLNLLVNTAEAFALRAPPPLRRFAWGLLLFAGCDLCVGAWNLGLGGEFARVGMWFFYLPSQVLIVLSQGGKGERL